MSVNTESWLVEAWSGAAAPAPARSPDGPPAEGAAQLQYEFVERTVREMLACPDAETGSRLLANRLQQVLGCRQVAVGLRAQGRGHCRIRGLSGVVGFDSHSAFIGGLRDAVEETLIRGAETAWPPRDHADRHGARAHEKLVSLLGAECVASVPLTDGEGRTVGAVLLVDEPAAEAFAFFRRHAAILGACLASLERARRGPLGRLLRRVCDTCMTHKGRLVLVAAVLLALLPLVPWSYQIRCPCVVQPVNRRFVVAPHDGILEQALVAPGDVVQPGDVLARMDERETRWELAGLKADLGRSEKERAAAMAARKTAAAQLAELEMERLRVQIALLEHRLENLALRSPLAGIVVAGDLERAQGAPLSIGQTLFEVAPLDRMVVELLIPEDTIARVGTGMAATVHLHALPGRPLPGVIERIHPRAELRDQASVFVADLEVDNETGHLRPGMNGWARVAAGRRSLGWILLHKPWNSLRRMLVW
jgi:RND family efflux transporter MFP subunit